MYILADGVKISEKVHEQLCRAIKDTSRKYFYFLDCETGKLVRVHQSFGKKSEKIRKETQRFVSLPTVTEDERRKCFMEFVELGIIDVPKLEEKLKKEIKRGAKIDELEKILREDSSGWIHGWVEYEHSFFAGKIQEWIYAPPLNGKDDLDYWYDDDCPVCQLMRKMEEENRSPGLTETKEAFKKAKNQDAFVGGELLEEEGFRMPKWMECTWRRVPCGRDDCPICGRIKKDRQRHIEKGEDPDDIKYVLEDAGRNFKEALQMIKRDAERMGIKIANIDNIKEPPEPEEFSLYRKVEEWNKKVFKIAKEAELSGNWWIYTETSADLFWYANILLAKVYRQFCNRWHIENGDDYGEFDY